MVISWNILDLSILWRKKLEQTFEKKNAFEHVYLFDSFLTTQLKVKSFEKVRLVCFLFPKLSETSQ